MIFTTSMALMVVSSLEAAMQPSSGDPPSHMPTKAATERAAWMYTIRSPSRTPGALGGGTQRGSSQSSHFSGRLSAASCVRSSGSRACIITIIKKKKIKIKIKQKNKQQEQDVDEEEEEEEWMMVVITKFITM